MGRDLFLATAVLLAAAVLSSTGVPAAGPAVPEGWRSGIGLSRLADPGAAADEAAAKAKAGLGGADAKFVFVGAAIPQLVPALVDGVKKHFPGDIIYGCQVTSPLLAESNFPDSEVIDISAGVEVWALGGDAVDIGVFSVSTDQDSDVPYEEAGLILGREIKPFIEGLKRPGRMVFTFGDQFNGSNKDFVAGLNQALERVYPIVGAAAGNQNAKEIVKGEIVTAIDVGVVIGGPFRLGQSLLGGTHSPDTANVALADAVGQGGGEPPFFAMIFNCRRRRQGMIENKQLADELAMIKKNLPGVEFFGFYGPGEVGSVKPGEPAKGVGFTVTSAVFFAAK